VIGSVSNITAQLANRPELVSHAPRINVSELGAWRREEPQLQIVDVRNPSERTAGSIEGAIHVPLPTLLDRLDELEGERPTLVYCAGGYRSSTAASLLRFRGFTTVADLLGGYDAAVPGAKVGDPQVKMISPPAAIS
jgi:rhodanese-related sulfurtransferase